MKKLGVHINDEQLAEILTLIVKIREGDKDAFQLLYDRTWKSVYYMLQKKIDDEDDALLLLNEVFAEIYENLHRLENPSSFMSWVTKIVFTRSMNFLKEKYRLSVEELQAEAIDFEEMDEEFIPEKALMNKETHHLILQTVEELPQAQRETIFMFYYQNLTVAEIADITSSPENRVYKRLHDAKKSLKVKLTSLMSKGMSLYGMADFCILREIFQADIEAHAARVPQAAVWQGIEQQISVAKASTAKITFTKSICIGIAVVAAVAAASKLPKPGGVATEANGVATFQSNAGATIATMPTQEGGDPDASEKTQGGVPTSSTGAHDSESGRDSTNMLTDPDGSAEARPMLSKATQEALPEKPEEAVLNEEPSVITETPAPKGETETAFQDMEPKEREEAPTEAPAATVEIQVPVEKPPIVQDANAKNENRVPTPQANGKPATDEPGRDISTDIIPVTATKYFEHTYEIHSGPEKDELVEVMAVYSGGLFNPMTDTVTIMENDFDGGKAGSYRFKLSAIRKDDGGIVDVQATLYVADTIAPVIRVENSLVTMESGQPITLAGILEKADVDVSDNSGEDIELDVTGFDEIDSDTPGQYRLALNATDSQGNKAFQKIIIVTIS